MESDVEVELLRKLRKRGVGVSAIATDNDSSTIKKCRDEIDPNLQKHADVGHTTKNLKVHVETISSRHQGVTQKVIGHFKKCFMSTKMRGNLLISKRLAECRTSSLRSA